VLEIRLPYRPANIFEDAVMTQCPANHGKQPPPCPPSYAPPAGESTRWAYSGKFRRRRREGKRGARTAVPALVSGRQKSSLVLVSKSCRKPSCTRIGQSLPSGSGNAFDTTDTPVSQTRREYNGRLHGLTHLVIIEPGKMAVNEAKTTVRLGPQDRTVRPTRRVAALLGFLLKAEVDAIFQQQPFETLDGADPLELWRQFNNNRLQLTPLITHEVETLPDSLDSVIDEIKNRKTYMEHYEAAAEYSFVSASIESLLAPQWFADLDYIDEVKGKLTKDMSPEDLLRFAMSEGKITEPIVTGKQVVFTSPRRDLYADPIPTVREINGGEFEIVVRAASRPNYVQVVRIGESLLLSNGVHKVCALHQMGYTETPCVYRKAHNLAEAGINLQSTSLFRDPIFKSQRPAIVTDFLNPQIGVPLRMRSMYQILQVSVGVGTHSVPALPEPQGETPKAANSKSNDRP